MTIMAILLLFIFFVLFFLYFWQLNPELITIFYLPDHSLSYPVAVVVVGCVIVGVACGIAVHLYSSATHWMKHWKRDRAEKKSREIGAIYRDAGIEPAREFVLRIFSDRLQKLDPTVSLKDPKTRLQEMLQKHGRPLPDYNVLDVDGPPHRQTFRVECVLRDPEQIFHGTGSSRRKAEQDAADLALDDLAAAG